MIGRRNWARLLPAAALVAVAGCAPSTTGMPTAAVVAGGAAAAASGPTPPETSLDCRQLKVHIGKQLELMTNAANTAKSQQQGMPNTVVSALGRMFGSGGDGIPAIADYEREKGKAEALNAALAGKGCQPVDLEKEGAASRRIIESLRQS